MTRLPIVHRQDHKREKKANIIAVRDDAINCCKNDGLRKKQETSESAKDGGVEEARTSGFIEVAPPDIKNSVMLSVHSLHLTPVQKKLKKTVSFQRMKLINCGFYTRDSQQPKAVWTTYSSTWLYSSGGKSKRWGEKKSPFFLNNIY